MQLTQQLQHMAEQARLASQLLATLTTLQKNQILQAMAAELQARQNDILAANAQDVSAAQQAGISPALLDRLSLTPQRITAMAQGILQVSRLADPVGVLLHQHQLANGLLINKVRVPIGVIAVIYESRPNVTVDVSALCLKAGNVIILRGGSDAFYSNQALSAALIAGGNEAGLPPHALQWIANTERAAISILASMQGKIDLLIPRGGENLIKQVTDVARVPVIKHYKGLCSIYVDASADPSKALAICENAKCQRPGVCNAVETLLINQSIAPTFLPLLAARLQALGVEIRGDAASRDIVANISVAHDEDWKTEYLDLILAIKIVPDVSAAIAHINTYGSHHSDAIIAEDENAQQQFTAQVDSAAVYVNASTRFTDGEQFGMGAEIGISTDKLHARGPMGLEELTTYKYIVHGTGQIRQ